MKLFEKLEKLLFFPFIVLRVQFDIFRRMEPISVGCLPYTMWQQHSF